MQKYPKGCYLTLRYLKNLIINIIVRNNLLEVQALKYNYHRSTFMLTEIGGVISFQLVDTVNI